jgi:hypothetical protein
MSHFRQNQKDKGQPKFVLLGREMGFKFLNSPSKTQVRLATADELKIWLLLIKA